MLISITPRRNKSREGKAISLGFLTRIASILNPSDDVELPFSRNYKTRKTNNSMVTWQKCKQCLYWRLHKDMPTSIADSTENFGQFLHQLILIRFFNNLQRWMNGFRPVSLYSLYNPPLKFKDIYNCALALRLSLLPLWLCLYCTCMYLSLVMARSSCSLCVGSSGFSFIIFSYRSLRKTGFFTSDSRNVLQRYSSAIISFSNSTQVNMTHL